MNYTSDVWGIIPARMGSSRFPGKMLADINGKPLLEWTWSQAKRSSLINQLMIASADPEITVAAKKFGAEVVEVYVDLPSGSDRIERAVRELELKGHSASIIVNIQGDEPMLDPTIIDELIHGLKNKNSADVTTPISAIKYENEYHSPSVVKVVKSVDNYAMYFSRSPIPDGWSENGSSLAWRHVGIYAFRRASLKRFVDLPISDLEKTERLEQLRMLCNGMKVLTVPVAHKGIGVDTPDDLHRVKLLMMQNL